MDDQFRLIRFRDAQDVDFDAALAEIRSGSKRGHWIWHVFPQLAGLGSSPAARLYGIANEAEATQYLRDPVLRARLRTITAAVDEQLTRGVGLVALMGSQIDALKLVSSLTLFEAVARRLAESDGDVDYVEFAGTAGTILAIAASQGFPRCRFTIDRLRVSAS